MPVTKVQGPDGRQYDVTHPEGASQEEVISFAQQQSGQQANPSGTIDADDPLLVDVAKGLFTGTAEATVNTVAGITQWAGQSFGNDSMLEAAEDMRQYSQGIGTDVGLDAEFGESLPGQVFRGIGQFPVTVAAGAAGFAVAGPVGMVGAAALTTGGQMSTEFLNDMEQTVGKGYTNFSPSEKDQALKGMLAQTAIGTALETAAVGKIMSPVLRKLATSGVSNKVLKEAIKKQKGALREMSEAAGSEGLTEALQGQSLDTIASLLYDEDRELVSLDVLRQRSMEFAVGSIVGGTISGGVQVIGGAPSAPSGGTKADLKKPVQERSELTIPDAVTVTYKPIDGPVKTVSLAIDPGQDPKAAVEAELAGRYDTTYPMQIDTVSAPVPVGPEQELDLPDQAPDATQEDVPVQPEAAVEPKVSYFQRLQDWYMRGGIAEDGQPIPKPVEPEAAVEPTVVEAEAPVEQVLPEVVPQVVPATEAGTILESELLEKNPDATKGILNTIKEIISNESSVNYGIDGDGIITAGGLDFRQKIEIQLTKDEKIALNKLQAAKSADDATIEGNIKIAEEFNVIMRKALDRAITKEPTQAAPATEQAPAVEEDSFPVFPEPSVETQPEFDPFADPEPEQAPEARSFSLPQNLKKGEPGYAQTQNITFASDLERASYSATTKTKSDPATRKRQQYRNLLRESGYSDAEINTMGAEVRAQMKGQYKGKGSSISVSLGQDVVAEAAPLEMSKVSDENNSSRIGTALQKGKNTTTPEDNVSPDRITPANLKKQMGKMTHFVKKVVKDGKEKGRNVKFPKWMRAKRGAKAQAEAFIKQFKDNLVALHNAFPAEYRTRATQWYDGARKIVDRAAEQTGLTSEQVAGVMAALSPLKDWFQNVQMGLNLVDVAVNDSDNVFTSAQYEDAINIVLEQSADNTVKNQRKKLFKLLEGKTIRELFNEGTEESKQLAAWAARIISTQKHGFYHDVLSPEGNSLGIRRNKDGSPKTMVWQSIPFIVKSLDIVYDGSVQNISNQLGKKHKIRNFYNNIIAPNNPYGDATIDTHAVNATTLFPMGGSGYQADLNFGKAGVGGGGVSGTYWLHLEAYKQAAKEVGIQPRQMQSITWEAVRMLFPDSSKRDQKFLDKYEQIWNDSTDAETTRQQILSEGIEPPEWATYRPRPLSGTEAVEASVRENARPKVEPAGSVQADNGRGARPDVTAQATDTEVEDRGPRDTYDNGGQVQDAIEKEFDPIGKKINVKIVMRMKTDYVARYNATQGIIEYNPMLLLKRSKAGIRAAMREEIIHAAMHKVIMVSARKKFSMAEGGKGWTDFFGEFGKSLTDAERADIKDVYQNIKPDDYVGYGSEYSRAVIQNLLYGEFSEEYQMQSQGGPAWNTIVKLLRSVQAYMAKVLGPMIKTNPEAAQVIVDSVELLKAVDPSIRPKSQDVVAQAYDATDKNTAKENTEAGERVGKDSSERIREERKWFDGAFRKTASKYLTPVITRLNRIHPMFGRILQNLDSAIRMRSMGYRKQTEMFFNKLNAVKGAEFQELKQLIFFSPTPEEANLPSNKAKMQRRDALLHKHGLLNMYRLDVQPILEEIYAEYTALGMPKIGYLEDYFPRVIKDLEGLIKSYGHKTKRTFELLVNEENIRRSELKDKDGNPASLPEMQETELGRFFQDFLQGKFRVDLNGVKLPGNVKAREIQLIPEDKLKFYDEPGVAFGKYTTNMARAIESFKVVGDTKKGEGRLLGELGKLTEELFTAGQIDQADASEVKSLTELITSQFQAENQILKSLGTLTYMATLINPGPVLVQIMDLYKVALYRGLGGVVSGTYRTVTGNRRFDIERDFGIAKTQLSAEFEDPSFLTKALDFGLSRLVPFRQMDTAMKHASIEAAYDDFVKKAKAPVGSKKHQQLIDYLTIKMGPEGARKAIDDLKLDRAAESTEIKEALLSELLERQPLTYLQVPEGYQTDPSKRLFYKLSTFMLLDLNYNRQEFMNDLGGPGKTLKQRTVALRRLAYMATLLTMFGLPSDLLDDWISGKDTYIPEHVMNNMLGMFGLSRYTTSRALNKGAVESVIQRFTPPAINIMIDGEQSLRSWVKGDKELFDIKSWRNSPLSDVWYYRTGGGVESQRKYQKKQRKEGITPSIDR